jgi:hypothetical protein
LIIADDRPFGYVRWQRPARADLDAAGLQEVPDTAMDIDIAIGDLDCIGLRVGPRAVKQVVDALSDDAGISMIVLATSVDNTSAVRAYEKAGFTRRRRFQDPECGECWLFTLKMPVQQRYPADSSSV